MHLNLGLESAAVENVSVFFVGIVVLRGIIGVATPPIVSIDKRQRSHVEQQQVLHIAGKYASLDRSTDRHDLIRVHALVAASLPNRSFTSF